VLLILVTCTNINEIKDEDVNLEVESFTEIESIDCKPKDTTAGEWEIQYININETDYSIRVKSKVIDTIYEYIYDCSFPSNVIPIYYWSNENNLCLRSYCGINCYNDVIIDGLTGGREIIRNAICYDEEKKYVVCVDEIGDDNIILKSINNKEPNIFYNIKVTSECSTIVECIDSVKNGKNKFVIYLGSERLDVKY